MAFHAISTPTQHVQLHLDAKPAPPKFALVPHIIAGLLMLYAIFAITANNTPMTAPITTLYLDPLWDVNPKVKGSGHSEMVIYTYLFFAVILPMFVAFLIVRLATRGATFPVPALSHMLQRKPRFLWSLVSYGEVLFLLAVVVGNTILFYNMYLYSPRIKATSKTQVGIEKAAKTLGFSTLYNMVFLALPASRHCFWMEWLGIPYANGVKYHRWLGVATILCATLHTAFYVKVYIVENDAMTLLPCFDCNVAKGGKPNWINTFGWLSFLSMFVMGITSLPYVRRHYYKIFYATHFLFIPATAFAIMHWGYIAIWLFATIVLYIGNRMLSSATIQAPVVIQKAAAYPHEVTELVFECATSYQAGDVVYLKVPSVSKTQWHPSNVAPRPYANVSTLRQVLLFIAAFFGAGSLFVAVHYNTKITTADPSYWPLQRLMEFLAIVIGAYWAYVVVLVKPYTPVPVARSQVDEVPKEPMMSDEAFIERYSVQKGRMDWPHFFSSLVDGTTKSWTTPAIGVYVSGPKTLSRAIDAQAHSTRFAVHHEEFEM
ncbi:hypothetical protein SPRG_19397 [Saprolegnia parasitica CBS 223.65]|uniref:Ferric oxidoreductase domain-containing protein n=1 Tax=Saprolegnia parasitica (strain CBS 223.65) TaxID=695850 RepID=A0A067CRG6_SAPPC|nr:hypothetical protein SPRG_19397 [Saprolegnia parasitica CBS 223.65]KDO33279.1 hypothetical protein SPRG_19397 [Saprolegnia parasitica CBS 223.65]|eukprot:XP_012196276.1 hypothetical protein SPRG_19397 [Saprolegnia parasitica CBS 223.65]